MIVDLDPDVIRFLGRLVTQQQEDLHAELREAVRTGTSVTPELSRGLRLCVSALTNLDRALVIHRTTVADRVRELCAEHTEPIEPATILAILDGATNGPAR